MMYDNNRASMRMPFFETWRKMQANETLEPLEKELANIIAQHPEYHSILNNPQENLERDHWPELGETNPFLHMALHQAIHEQISTNRPHGILEIYKNLCERVGAHNAEHQMISTLGEILHKMQANEIVTEVDYLDKLRKLIK